jgi:hypothetical protein
MTFPRMSKVQPGLANADAPYLTFLKFHSAALDEFSSYVLPKTQFSDYNDKYGI